MMLHKRLPKLIQPLFLGVLIGTAFGVAFGKWRFEQAWRQVERDPSSIQGDVRAYFCVMGDSPLYFGIAGVMLGGILGLCAWLCLLNLQTATLKNAATHLKWFCSPLLMASIFTTGSFCQSKEDKCTVTLFDAAAVKKLMRKIDEDASLVESKKEWRGVEVLGEFDTVIDEERLTSKAFRIPNTKKYVIASVYYTDESMSVSAGKEAFSNNSVYVGVALSSRKEKSAMKVSNRSLAEVNVSEYLKAVRVSKLTRIRGRNATIVLECRWNSSVEMK